ADRNRSHWSTSKTPSYTKSVSWQHHHSVSIIMPLLYLSMGIMYLYQKNKIRNMLWLDANLKKTRILNLKVLFVAALSIMLSIVAHINFAINSLLIMQWLKA
ncbi:hypothetical protein NKU63_22030, partial [Enterobacter cloacae]